MLTAARGGVPQPPSRSTGRDPVTGYGASSGGAGPRSVAAPGLPRGAAVQQRVLSPPRCPDFQAEDYCAHPCPDLRRPTTD